MRQPTRLVRDSTGRYKLEISLPGGRYQLSLDDRAEIVLTDNLGLSVRDTVPDPLVPFFVATGDAWFPRQRDVDTIIQDLPSNGDLSSNERSALITYLTESRIPERNEERVRTVLKDSPVADEVEPTSLQIQELPAIPDVLNPSKTQETTVKDTASTSEERLGQKVTNESNTSTSQIQSETPSEPEEEILELLQQIPGIGPLRAEQLIEGGVRSLETVSDSRPVDLARIDGISEDLAAVTVEGAREILGDVDPASKRLKHQTGIKEEVYDPALSSLAASGVPASEAIPTLRVLYGPTVADIDAVSGQQAYYLWEAGYQTPYDLIEASTDELIEVFQIGSTTAPKIQTSARELLDRKAIE